MHERKTRHDSSDANAPRPARPRQMAEMPNAGNRALAEVLGPRPVQRWPDMEDLGGLFGGGPTLGNPTPDLGGFSLPSMPSMPDLGELLGGGGPSLGNPTPDLGGLLPSLPSMPDLGGLMPSMPNIPGVSLNVDTDAGTASGGIDFHDGTSGRASYGPGGFDVSGQSGRSQGSGHVGAANDWSFSGSTTTKGGTSLGGSLSDDRGRFSGSVVGTGANGDQGLLSAHGGRGGFGGLGNYAGEYGNLRFPF
jgi:hypothetical protein